ncbi:MAG: protein kinase domain-containing protein, partial [Planctomycetota bacterium]
ATGAGGAAGPHATEATLPDSAASARAAEKSASKLFGPSRAGVVRSGKDTPPETAATLPGRPVGAPSPGTRMVSGSSRVHAPRPEEFRIEAKLASGGMGTVYVARQLGLERVVALKRPKGAHGNEQRLSAFVREGTVTGDLEHPSIVPIYQNGIDTDGLPFYAMKLVQGIEWRYLLHPELARERNDPEFVKTVAKKGAAMDLHEHLNVLLKVCDAVAFAHSRHVLHRDLKPENIIVGDFGEVLVMDWGLAIDFRDATPADAKALSRSEIRGPAGTPAYMSPEMALGESKRIGPATDVYLLGAILYEVLTGKPPHAGGKLDRVLYQAAINDITPVPKLSPLVSPSLVAIVDRALATDPAARFPSVAAFQQAIREHLTHEQSLKISAKAADSLDALLNPPGPALTPSAFAPPTAATLAAGRQPAAPKPLDRAAAEAEANARYVRFAEAVAAFRQALELWSANPQAQTGLVRGLSAFVRAALAGGDLGLAGAQLEELRRALPADATPAQKSEVDALARRLAELTAQRQARQRNFKLALSAVAVLLAVLVIGGAWSYFSIRAERDRATAEKQTAEEQRAQADIARGQAESERAKAQHQTLLAEQAQMDANQQRAAAEQNATLARQSADDARKAQKNAEDQKAEADAQRKLAVTQKAEAEKQRALADAARKVAESKTVEAEEQRKQAEANLKEAQEQRAAAVMNLGAIDIERARTLMAADRDFPQAAAFFLRAAEHMASVDPSQPLRDLDGVFLTSPKLRGRVDLHGCAFGLFFYTCEPQSVSDQVAVLTAADGFIWSSTDPSAQKILSKPGAPEASGRAFAAFGPTWIFLENDGALRWSNLPSYPGTEVEMQVQCDPLPVPGQEHAHFTCLAPDSTHNRIALGTADGRVIVVGATGPFHPAAVGGAYPPPTLQVLLDLPAHDGAVSAVQFVGNSDDEILTCGADGKLCAWSIAQQKLLRERVASTGFVSTLSVDPAGSTVATAGPDGVIKIWNAGDFSERLTLQGHSREVASLAFHPTRPELASQSYDGTVRLWNVGAEQDASPCLATLHVPDTRAAAQVAFSPDGQTLACLDTQGVEFWDLTDRTDATPAAWAKLSLPGAHLLFAADGEVALLHESDLLTLHPGDRAPTDQTVDDLAAAFRLPAIPAQGGHPAVPARTICLTRTGLIGSPGHLEPMKPELPFRVTGFARRGKHLVINREGRFFYADLSKPDLQFVEIHGDADSAGLALAPDGRYISWSKDGDLAISTPPTNLDAFSATHFHAAQPRRIFQAEWLPDGRRIVLRTGQANLPIVDDQDMPVGSIPGRRAPIRTLALSPDGRLLAIADASGRLRLIDLGDMSSTRVGPTLTTPADHLLFDDSGAFLICHLETGALRRYRLPAAPTHIDLPALKVRIQADLGIDPDQAAPLAPASTGATPIASPDEAPPAAHASPTPSPEAQP